MLGQSLHTLTKSAFGIFNADNDYREEQDTRYIHLNKIAIYGPWPGVTWLKVLVC